MIFFHLLSADSSRSAGPVPHWAVTSKNFIIIIIIIIITIIIIIIIIIIITYLLYGITALEKLRPPSNESFFI